MNTFKTACFLAVLALPLVAAHSQSWLTNGLVAYYPFNGNATDASGNGNNGNLGPGIGFASDRFGMHQASLFFTNGVAGEMTTTVLQPVSDNFTIALWFNLPTGYTNNADLIALTDTESGGHSSFDKSLLVGPVGGSTTNNLSFFLYPGHTVFLPTPESVSDGNWHHVVATLSPLGMMLYLDGNLVSTNSNTLSQDFAGYWRIAAGQGFVDDVRIYNRALSSVEVAELYAFESITNADTQSSLTNGLVCLYPFNGTAADVLGHGNTGTLYNGAYYTNGISGQPNGSIYCNGNAAYVYMGKNDSVYPNQILTWTIWFKPELDINPPCGNPVIPGNSFIFWDDDWTPGGDRAITFSINTNFPTYAGSLQTGALSTSNQLSLNTWHQAVFTSDNDGQNFYLDGILVSSLNVIIANHAGRSSVSYGAGNFNGAGSCANNAYGKSFQGAIAESRIYNRALSPYEVAQLYAIELPLPRTATGTATFTNGFVDGVSINDAGSGYTNTPLVRLIGGGGSGAAAFAVINNGVVISITLTNAGYGYTNAPLVVIDPPFMPIPVLGIAPMSFLSFSNLAVGGAYQLQQAVGWYWTNQPFNFTATNSLYTQMVSGVVGSGGYRLALNPVPTQAFAAPEVVNGFVVGATVTSGGSGYVTSPAVTIVGRGGTNATAISHISGGVVTSINITAAGIGYTNATTIEIAPPPASAVAPTVQPVMRVNSSNLAPYDNYQIQFTPAIGGTWGNWNGGLFTPTAVTNSQFLFVTNTTGFFRLLYEP